MLRSCWVFRSTSSVAMALSVCALAACSSGTSGTSSGTPAGDSTAKTLSLSVDFTAPSANNADGYWAYVQGIWTKLGLKVSYKTSGSTVPVEVSSGHDIVAAFGPSAIISPIEAGRPVSVIACQSTGVNTAGVVASTTTSIHTVMDLSGKTVASTGPGSNAYGAAQVYSKYLVKNGGKPLHIEVFSGLPAIEAALSSGHVQAAVGTNAPFAELIANGKIRVVEDATGTIARSLFPASMCSYVWYGLTSALQANREAVNRFVAGIRIADEQIKQASTEELAAALAKAKEFAPAVISQKNLEAGVEASKPFFVKDDHISPSQWNQTLGFVSAQGVTEGSAPVNLHGPDFAYSKVVDMSYWNAATALIKSAGISSSTAN
jgi:ABC-type nitrate/sulfonate/bicarbonate transport system substrate-binding protein